MNCCYLYNAQEYIINKIQVAKRYLIEHYWYINGKIIIGVLFIAIQIYWYYEFKSNLDKEYTFNDEYYSILKSIKNTIINILLLIFITEGNSIMIMIQRLNWNCFKKKEINPFVEIQ